MKGYVTQRAPAGTPSSTKASTRSPAESADGGTPPAPAETKPSDSPHAWRSSATAATTKPAPSPSAPTSHGAGCPARRSTSLPRPTTATAARSSATSSRPRTGPDPAAPRPNSSTRSTSRCSARPTAADRSHPRPCSRSTSSSAARSPRPSEGARQPERGARRPRTTAPVHPQGRARDLDRPATAGVPAAAAGHRLFPALWVLAATGMRRSELLGLRWNDIDLDTRRDQAQPRARLRRLRAPRVTRQDRQRTPPHRARPHDHRRARPPGGSGSAPNASPSAPPSRTGCSPTAAASRSTPTSSPRPSTALVRRAGVPVIRLHDLRHTHATLLIDAGVPVKVVSERLGHATAAFTIETYQHVLPEHADPSRRRRRPRSWRRR